MAFGNHGEYGSQSAEKVRPRETSQVGENLHKKAKRIDMSTKRFDTEYPISAAMNGYRGDPEPQREQAGDMNLQSFNKSETLNHF